MTYEKIGFWTFANDLLLQGIAVVGGVRIVPFRVAFSDCLANLFFFLLNLFGWQTFKILTLCYPHLHGDASLSPPCTLRIRNYKLSFKDYVEGRKGVILSCLISLCPLYLKQIKYFITTSQFIASEKNTYSLKMLQLSSI